MDNHRYRVVLTGELLPGRPKEAALAALADIFDAPAASLARIFDGGRYPLQDEFAAEEALDLQARLEAVGVVSKVERLDAPVDLRLRTQRTQATPPPVAPSSSPPARVTPGIKAGLMRCPACGFEQQVSERCRACGVIFEEYNRLHSRRNVPGHSGAATAGPAHAQRSWTNVWDEFEEEQERDEQYDLRRFFGPHADRYEKICKRCHVGGRNSFRLGWNWGAFLSPFLWAMYRKMWLWGAVISITEIFLPVLLITLGRRAAVLDGLEFVGYFVIVANRAVWPAIANYLYCCYSRASVARLHRLAPNSATEIDIATSGGVSTLSVVIGVLLGAVMWLFVWSVVDSLVPESAAVADLPPTPIPMQAPATPGGGSAGSAADFVNSSLARENKWVQTRTRLREFGQQANTWIARNSAAVDPMVLTLDQLQQSLSYDAGKLIDGWGKRFRYIPDANGYRLVSAGPDGQFSTADDIQYRRVLESR